MIRDSFDTGLEFIVLEGSNKGGSYSLASRRVQIGRSDPSYPEDGASRISFSEPTVSGLHVSLEWDEKKSRYLLTHHSRTNHTLVDGKVVNHPTYIHVGSKVKMGALVLQLRLSPQGAKAEPVPTTAAPLAASPLNPALAPVAAARLDRPPAPSGQLGFNVLVINGPDSASLFPIVHDSTVIQEPGTNLTQEPTFSLRGLNKCKAVLHWKPPQVHVTCGETGERPILIDNPLPGVVRQRYIGPELGNHFSPDSILLCNGIALTVVASHEASRARERLLAGETVNRLQPGLFHEGDRIWNRGEQHVFRFLAGPFKGMQLWLEPRRYETPLRLGRIGQNALVELTDRGAPTVEVIYKNEEFFLRNLDSEVALTFNAEELSSQQEAQLCCGDRFRLGRTLVRYEYLPIQSRIDTYSIVCEGRELPLLRQQNWLGNSPQADVRLDDSRLGPMHGRIVVGESSLRYQHRQPGSVAKINGKELRAGEESGLRVDTLVELLPGFSFRVVRRSSAVQNLEPAHS